MLFKPNLISLTGAFDDEDVTHIDGEVNPIRDILTIMDELRLKVVYQDTSILTAVCINTILLIPKIHDL